MKTRDDSRVYVPQFSSNKYVPSLQEMARIREEQRLRGRRVVLTQGVWDLLHRGHLRYLFAASQHGDVLVVGVDSDALTRKRKGEGRPVVPEEERIEMLSFIGFINHIVLHDIDQDIDDLIKSVSPDVLIVSETTKDFPKEKLSILEGCCGEIVRLKEQARTSSTERIRQLAIEGKHDLIARLEEMLRKAREE